MANQSEKRRLEANRKRLEYTFIAIVISNVWYIVVRFLVRRASVGWFSLVTLLASNVVFVLAYRMLKKAATPIYSGSGLVSGGEDLSMGGFLEYVNDAIILTVILQFLGGLTDWAWILVTVAPGYALYIGYNIYRKFQSSQSQLDDVGLKQREGKVRNRRGMRQSR